MRPLELLLSLLLIAPAATAESSSYEFVEEVERSTTTHAWAGAYGAFGGLYLAADGRYCTTSSSCFGTGYGPCGKVRPSEDRLIETGWNPLKQKIHGGPPFLRVPWGERHYLVPEDQILDFINEVNEGGEPRTDNRGGPTGYLRRDELEILVTGQPLVPEKYRAMLLPRPLMTTAVEISTRTNIITRYDSYEDNDCGAEARFDAGSSSGVFVGMELHTQTSDRHADVVIATVSADASFGRIKQFNCDKSDPLPKGTRFGSRPSWRLGSTLSTEPMTTEILFASAKRFPAFFGGEPDHYFVDDPFAGAAAAGFTVEPVATVKFRGKFLGALALKTSKELMTRTMLSLGANAFEWLEKRPDLAAEKAGGVEATTARLHRVSYRGRPLAPGHEFSVRSVPHRKGERLRDDWKGAVVSARAALCALPEARRTAERAAALELLRWDEAALARAHELRFEGLDPEKRRAAEELVSPGKRHGLVWPAVVLHSDFSSRIRNRGYAAEREFKRAHPEAAAECEKLEEASRNRPY